MCGFPQRRVRLDLHLVVTLRADCGLEDKVEDEGPEGEILHMDRISVEVTFLMP